MSPIFTVHDSVTAQFDQLFNREDDSKVSIEKVTEGVADDEEQDNTFVQRFAKALIEHRERTSETCDTAFDPDESALQQTLWKLERLCIIDDAQEYVDTEQYGSIMVSKAELLAVLLQLEYLWSIDQIDMFAYQEGIMPYSDVKQDRRYTPRVYKAVADGMLDGIGEWSVFSKRLQPLGPVTWNEFERMIKNSSSALTMGLPKTVAGETYVTKQAMVRFVDLLYRDKLASAEILAGNNMVFYEWILKKTMDKSPAQQEQFVRDFVDGFAALPKQSVEQKYTLAIDPMISFLEWLLLK